MAKKLESKSRLTLEIGTETRKQMTELAVRAKCASVTEVIRRAVALLDIAIEFQEKGGKLIFREKSGKEEVVYLL